MMRKSKNKFALLTSQVGIEGVGTAADVIAQEIVDGLNIFFDTEIDDTTTLGDLLEELLDISLIVDEDCLHLAVYTPYEPDMA